MKNFPNEQYLRLAKELTGSSNIDEVIDSARKIAQYMNESSATSYHSMYNLAEFARSCKIQHVSRGLIPFEPYDYQVQLLHDLKQPGSLLLNVSRQMGLSTLLCIYALHQCVTKPDQTILFVGPKFTSALDHLDRIRIMIEAKTNNMWPAIQTLNKSSIVFDNGSRIIGQSASSHAGRGLTIDTLIAVEAAYYSFAYDKEIWNAWYPTIHLGGKIIMVSTPNLAKGLFYDLWTTDNSFRKITCKWDEHPDRDQVWADSTRSMVGDLAFKREYECEFIEQV